MTSVPTADATPRKPRRGPWMGATRCTRGHDLTLPDALYVRPGGQRECRVCRDAGRRRHYKAAQAQR